jgi:hypothetical protein
MQKFEANVTSIIADQRAWVDQVARRLGGPAFTEENASVIDDIFHSVTRAFEMGPSEEVVELLREAHDDLSQLADILCDLNSKARGEDPAAEEAAEDAAILPMLAFSQLLIGTAMTSLVAERLHPETGRFEAVELPLSLLEVVPGLSDEAEGRQEAAKDDGGVEARSLFTHEMLVDVITGCLCAAG